MPLLLLLAIIGIIIAFIIYVGLCYFLVSLLLFRGVKDENEQDRKRMNVTIILALIGIGFGINWYLQYRAIQNCNGFESKIEYQEIMGKWQDENSFLEFNPDTTYSIRYFEGGGKEQGRFEIEENILFLHSVNRKGNKETDSYKFCDFSNEKFVFQSISSLTNYTAERIK